MDSRMQVAVTHATAEGAAQASTAPSEATGTLGAEAPAPPAMRNGNQPDLEDRCGSYEDRCGEAWGGSDANQRAPEESRQKALTPKSIPAPAATSVGRRGRSIQLTPASGGDQPGKQAEDIEPPAQGCRSPDVCPIHGEHLAQVCESRRAAAQRSRVVRSGQHARGAKCPRTRSHAEAVRPAREDELAQASMGNQAASSPPFALSEASTTTVVGDASSTLTSLPVTITVDTHDQSSGSRKKCYPADSYLP